MLSMALLLISGIGWTIVYLASIKIGFKEKTYCIPIFALALNIAWETIYAINGTMIAIDSNVLPDPQTIVNGAWMLCDCAIVVTFFKFGRRWLPQELYGRFAITSALIFLTGIGFQLAFYFQLPWLQAAQYSAFAQNVIMSVLFVTMFFYRKGPEGQSLVIAIAKCIGTLAPTLQQGIVEGFNVYIVLMGALCLIWDLIYVSLLVKCRAKQKATSPVNKRAFA